MANVVFAGRMGSLGPSNQAQAISAATTALRLLVPPNVRGCYVGLQVLTVLGRILGIAAVVAVRADRRLLLRRSLRVRWHGVAGGATMAVEAGPLLVALAAVLVGADKEPGVAVRQLVVQQVVAAVEAAAAATALVQSGPLVVRAHVPPQMLPPRVRPPALQAAEGFARLDLALGVVVFCTACCRRRRCFRQSRCCCRRRRSRRRCC